MLANCVFLGSWVSTPLVAFFSLLLPTRVAQEIWWHKKCHQEHLGAENIDKAMLANFKLVPCDPYKWSYGVPKKWPKIHGFHWGSFIPYAWRPCLDLLGCKMLGNSSNNILPNGGLIVIYHSKKQNSTLNNPSTLVDGWHFSFLNIFLDSPRHCLHCWPQFLVAVLFKKPFDFCWTRKACHGKFLVTPNRSPTYNRHYLLISLC